MTVASHIVELKKKHEHLTEMVEKAQRAPGSSDLQTRRMEKAEIEDQGRNQPPVSRLIAQDRAFRLARAARAAPPVMRVAAKSKTGLASARPPAIRARVDSSGAA